MPRIEFNKLVRDRIPEIIEADGRQCRAEVMPKEEYQQALLAKLSEEAVEAREAALGQLVTELADLYEVLDAVIAAHDIDPSFVLQVQQERRAQRGGFERRIKLLWVDDA